MGDNGRVIRRFTSFIVIVLLSGSLSAQSAGARKPTPAATAKPTPAAAQPEPPNATPPKPGDAAKPATPAPAKPPVPEPPTVGPDGIPIIPGMEKALAGGQPGPLPKDYTFAISAKNQVAADLTNRGFYQIELFNSPDATRHFLLGLRQDDNCPMAWIGLYLALLERGEEAKAARAVCYRRATLLRAKALGREGAWIDALGALHLQGTPAFASALDLIRKDWPEDLHAQVLLPLMLRDGCDDSGAPKAGQKAAEGLIKLLLEKRPNDPVVMHADLQIALVGPKPQDALTLARSLLALNPPSAYYHQAAGQVLFRCGDPAAAAAAFDRARLFDEKRLPEIGVASEATPTYFDNLHCLAMALVECGRREQALAIAHGAREVSLPWSSQASASVREFAFFTSTLESFVHARCGEWPEALEALPEATHPLFRDGHPAGFFVEALQCAFTARAQAQAKKPELVRKQLDKLQHIYEAMTRATPDARAKGLDPQWSEAVRITEFLLLDVRATANFLEGDRTLAALWWRSAAERQPDLRLRPVPRWPRLAAESMAVSFAAGGDLTTAHRAWEQAVTENPNSGWCLAGLVRLRDALNDKDGATKARQGLRAVWAAADPDLRALADGPLPDNPPEPETTVPDPAPEPNSPLAPPPQGP